MTVSFNRLSSQEKIDTLYFVKTQAVKIIIRLFPEKSITVQEIVGIKDDSIRENDSFTSRGVANLKSAADLKGS